MREASRRRLIGGLGATVATLGVAGCLADSGGGTDEPATRTETATATTVRTTEDERRVSASLVDWVPTAEALGAEKVAFYHADIAAIRELRGSLPGGFFDRAVRALVTGQAEPVLPTDRLRTAVAIQTARTTVVETDMTPEELGRTLTEAGFEERGGHGPATLYGSDGDTDQPTATFAVLDGVVVRSLGTADRGLVEAVVDAATGDGDRLAAANEDVSTLYELTSGAHLRVLGTNPADAAGRSGLLADADTLAYAWEFGADETTFTGAATYPEESLPAAGEFASFFDSSVTPEHYGEFEGTVEGQVVSTTGTLATDQLALFGSGGGGSGSTSAPQASFEFRYDESSETVTVVHDGGDGIRSSRLSIRIGDRMNTVSFEGETVTAGSSVELDVSDVESGTTIRVVWESDDGHTQVLAQFTLP